MLLPSGAELEITMPPFAVSRALYQAVLEELKGAKINSSDEVDVNLFKDLFCVMLSSKKVDAALTECMKRATYNGLKIDADTFEPAAAREDYITVCFEVAKVSVIPFLKSLYAEFFPLLGKLKSSLA